MHTWYLQFLLFICLEKVRISKMNFIHKWLFSPPLCIFWHVLSASNKTNSSEPRSYLNSLKKKKGMRYEGICQSVSCAKNILVLIAHMTSVCSSLFPQTPSLSVEGVECRVGWLKLVLDQAELSRPQSPRVSLSAPSQYPLWASTGWEEQKRGLIPKLSREWRVWPYAPILSGLRLHLLQGLSIVCCFKSAVTDELAVRMQPEPVYISVFRCICHRADQLMQRNANSLKRTCDPLKKLQHINQSILYNVEKTSVCIPIFLDKSTWKYTN